MLLDRVRGRQEWGLKIFRDDEAARQGATFLVRRTPGLTSQPNENARQDLPLLAERLALIDALDQLVKRGVIVVGEATLSLAGIDLIYVGLNVLIGSVETLRAGGPPASPAIPGSSPPSAPMPDRLADADTRWYTGVSASDEAGKPALVMSSG